MTTVAVIPARYDSVRLPGKPLLCETGKYLVQHVYEQVLLASRVDDVWVATDDERIAAAVRSFQGKAVLTRGDHLSGTDRVAEAVASLDPRPDVVLNVQGDEPEIEPADLDLLVETLLADSSAAIATLAVPLPDGPGDASQVKVVIDHQGRALYFSRAAIPHFRQGGGSWLGHVGVYAFTADALERFVALAPSPLEEAEKLEQNRALWWGMPICVGLAQSRPRSIDTPEDYQSYLLRSANP
jgi:3-deoxy-manno-octulosonate cytidylyltransferase (CMP-KDO synthetase)